MSDTTPGIGKPRSDSTTGDLDRLLRELKLEFDDKKCEALIQQIGGLRDPRGVPTLLGRLTRDKAPNVRRASAIALYQIGDPQIWPIMINRMSGAARDPASLVRSTLAELVGLLGDKKNAAALVQALHDDDASVRNAAGVALGKLRNPAVIESVISGLHQNAYSSCQYPESFIAALINMGPMVAEAVLGSANKAQNSSYALKEDGSNFYFPDSYIWQPFYAERIQVLKGLGVPAVSVIGKMLNKASEPERVVATEALGDIAKAALSGNPEGHPINLLCEIAQRDLDPAIRWLAVKNLAKVPTDQVCQTLLTVLQKDQDWRIRMRAAQALGEQKWAQAVGPLCTTMLQDTDPRVRRKAIESLVQIRDLAAVPSLEKVAVGDNAQENCHLAIRSLGQMKEKRAIVTLGNILIDDPDPIARQLSAEAMGIIGASDSFEYLIGALGRDDAPQVRREAAEVLGKIRDRRALGPLKIVADGGDPDKSVQSAAKDAIQIIQAPKVVPGNDPFQCPICGLPFSKRDYLKEHIANWHRQ